MADVLVFVDLVESSVGKPTFELLTLATRLGTPVAVVVDESLELARAYAGDDAVQYVNGVLGQIARERV